MKKNLSQKQQDRLLETLKARFEANMARHKGVKWSRVHTRLVESPEKLLSLDEMEKTGGEPDVIGVNEKTEEFIFVDCSSESPSGRRNMCYDPRALKERKSAKPRSSVIAVAQKMGIEILTENQYRDLQRFGPFDTKTSSWVLTPPEIRNRGGALFCDRRYDAVFVYHNGAESYYAARGFRGLLRV